MAGPDLDKVTALLEEVALETVMPRFRALRDEDIELKSLPGHPEDLVTIVDHQVERRLTGALRAMNPSVHVVGEETAHRTPDLLRHVAANDALWLLDPIDGTKNFVRGSERFGIMLAYVEQGETRASWVLHPARSRTFVAERGGGAWLNGERVSRPVAMPDVLPRGTLHTRYMPGGTAKVLVNAARGRFSAMPDTGCSAFEYTDILLGVRDFGVYYRLLPWDHAPGALLLEEGGGRVEHARSRRYSIRSDHQLTLLSSSEELARQLWTWLPEC